MNKYTRRKFLKNTVKGTAGLLTYPLLNTSNAGQFDNSRVIVIEDDSVLTGSTINQSVVQVMIDAGIRSLTNIQDLGEAWKSLFPGITQNKVISIKVSLLNRYLATHPEVTYSVINGLTSMQVEGSPFPENNIIIWDRWNSDLTNAGYTINTGSSSARCFGTNQSGVGYNSTQYSVNGSNQRISNILTDMSDYMINLSVLKNHSIAGVTLSMKNHYGTCDSPGSIHGGYCNPYIPALNNLQPIRSKQVINICDAIYGIISGGPTGQPQITPKSLIFSADPVACDYICAEMLQNNGCTTLNRATHIATAAQAPYNLGTNDPSQIDLVNISNPTSVEKNSFEINSPDKFRLYQNYPNPFNNQTTIPYQLFKSANVKISIFDTKGRVISNLVNEYKRLGYHKAIWDGKNSGGKTVSSGIYICKFKIDKDVRSYRIHLIK